MREAELASYIDDAIYYGSQTPGAKYEYVQSLIVSKPRITYVTWKTPKNKTPTSCKPIKTKDPAPGSYDPKYPLVAAKQN